MEGCRQIRKMCMEKRRNKEKQREAQEGRKYSHEDSGLKPILATRTVQHALPPNNFQLKIKLGPL
jgi:hypothetical protein